MPQREIEEDGEFRNALSLRREIYVTVHTRRCFKIILADDSFVEVNYE